MSAATFTQSLNIDPAPYVRRDKAGAARLELAVKGVRCANCIAKIESGLKKMPDVEDARVNLSTAKLSVRWREGRTDARNILNKIGELGFEAFPYDPEALLAQDDEEGRFLLRCLVVAGFAAANVMLLSVSIWSGLDADMGVGTRTVFYWLSALIAVPSAIYAGRPFFRSAFTGLSRGRANMDLPISLAIVLALGLSLYETVTGGRYAYYDAAVSLPFLLLIGRYLDHLLRRRARATARDLIVMQTVTATRIAADGSTAPVAPRDIARGDMLLLAAGDRTPVDGVIESGAGTVDVSLVTGESAPAEVAPGAVMRAGTVALSGPLTLRVTARVEDSLIAEIARLLEAGQQVRGRYVRLADRAAALYVPVVHGLALAALVGGLIYGLGVRESLTNAIALLIITCPCALGLAVPAVQIVATSRLFKRGLLVKSGDALERLAEADVAVFDKTGTLTLGRPSLIETGAPRAALDEAATLARASRHPLARALAAAAGPGPVAADVREVAGQGLEARVAGKMLRLGRASWVGAEGGTPSSLWFAREGSAPVAFQFADDLRADVHATVDALKARGLSVEMLSGDRDEPAARIAQEAGIATWGAAVDPTQKAAYVDRLRAEGCRVAMIGDGLNDAAAMAHAYVSISPGTAADATQATADMVFQGEDLAPLVEAVDVARAARARVFENFAFAALYNAVAIPFAALGYVTPLIAAIAMSGSSLIVMANALRLAAKR